MFKFKSYSVSKAEKKSETGKSNSSSSTGATTSTTRQYVSTGTLKKTTGATASTTRQYVSPKTKKTATANEIKAVNNYQPVNYSSKIYPKKTVTKWSDNKTFSSKKETEKVVIPSPHKKLERK